MVCPTMGGADGLGGESQPIDSLSTKKREGGTGLVKYQYQNTYPTYFVQTIEKLQNQFPPPLH